MLKNGLPVLLLICGTAFAGCSRGDVAGPEAVKPDPDVRILAGLDLTPHNVAVSEKGTVQLSVKALDQFGMPMAESFAGTGNDGWRNRVVYSSADPLIVSVSGSGVLTGIAPGTADVSAKLVVGGIAYTASVRATITPVVRVLPAGVYDLSAAITMFDPIWGDLTGSRYTGVMRIPADGVGGTFENLRLVDAAGVPSEWALGGTINNYQDFAGRLVSDLVDANFHFSLVAPAQSSVDPLLFSGGWGCCGHIAGTFTAKRR